MRTCKKEFPDRIERAILQTPGRALAGKTELPPPPAEREKPQAPIGADGFAPRKSQPSPAIMPPQL